MIVKKKIDLIFVNESLLSGFISLNYTKKRASSVYQIARFWEGRGYAARLNKSVICRVILFRGDGFLSGTC